MPGRVASDRLLLQVTDLKSQVPANHLLRRIDAVVGLALVSTAWNIGSPYEVVHAMSPARVQYEGVQNIVMPIGRAPSVGMDRAGGPTGSGGHRWIGPSGRSFRRDPDAPGTTLHELNFLTPAFRGAFI